MDFPVFIVVQEEGSHSDKDWKIRGVYKDLETAKIEGWKSFLNEIWDDHNLEFYQNRTARWAHLRSISDYHIQEWEGNTRKSVTYMIDDNRMDHHLKEIVTSGNDLRQTLHRWEDQLLSGTIPEFFASITFQKVME